MLISRLRAPTSVTEPTPRTFSRRWRTTWSAKVLSSCWLRCAVRRGQRQREDRPARRVEARDACVLDLVAQQGAHRGHLLAHIVGGLAPVHVQIELGDHHRAAFVGARGQLVDAGHRVDRLLDLARDLVLDDLGRRAGVVDLHHHGREVDVGELIDLQPLVRKQPQHDEGQHDHHGHHRVADRDAGEPHGRVPRSARRAGRGGGWAGLPTGARRCRRAPCRRCPPAPVAIGQALQHLDGFTSPASGRAGPGSASAARCASRLSRSA